MKSKAIWLSLMLSMVMAFFIPQTVMAAEQGEVLAQINTVREEEGLDDFILDPELCRLADIRAKEQAENFSHIRPDGSEWYTISPLVNRENIAHIEDKEQERYLLDAWMLSESHKENVLSEDSRIIGIGIYQKTENECYVVTLTD